MTQSSNQRELARRSAGVHVAHNTSKALAAAVSTFIVFAPMIERIALAQPQPVQQDRPKAEYNVQGIELSLTAGEKAIKVYTKYFIEGTQEISDPVLEVEGPAKFTVRFYPVVKREKFSEGMETYERDLVYSLGEVDAEPSINTSKLQTKISPYTAAEDYVDTTDFVIGTPVEITKEVGEGKHRFSVLSPNGFFELVNVEAVVVEKPPPVEVPIKPDKPKTPEPAKPVQVKETPKAEYDKLVVLFDAERLWLNASGSEENTGDMNYWQSRTNVWFDDNWAFVVGGMSSSYGLNLESDTTRTLFRSFSFDASAGLAYWNDGHYAYALANGGYRSMISTTVLFESPAGMRDVTDQFEIGGQAGYRFKNNLTLDASIINNPFNPLKGRLYGMLPVGWVPGDRSNPWLETNFLLLRTMTSVQSDDALGAAELTSDNIYLRALAGVPIWEFGTVVPSVIGGGEFIYPIASESNDGITGNFYAGGSLKTRSALEGDAGWLEVEAGAVGNTEGALIMLKLEHSK